MDEQALIEMYKAFETMGKNTGLELVELAKELHPDALFVIDLYRSCMVVLPKIEENDGHITVIFYHDPAWMGHEVTKESIKGFRSVHVIQGQRSGPDIFSYRELSWELEVFKYKHNLDLDMWFRRMPDDRPADDG